MKLKRSLNVQNKNTQEHLENQKSTISPIVTQVSKNYSEKVTIDFKNGKRLFFNKPTDWKITHKINDSIESDPNTRSYTEEVSFHGIEGSFGFFHHTDERNGAICSPEYYLKNIIQFKNEKSQIEFQRDLDTCVYIQDNKKQFVYYYSPINDETTYLVTATLNDPKKEKYLLDLINSIEIK